MLGGFLHTIYIPNKDSNSLLNTRGLKMAEFTNDLLKEAIADAEQVRETAIANAKLQLEESIAPTIKAELTKALSQTEEVEEALQEVEEVDEAHDPKGAEANDFAEVGEAVESADVADENSEVEIVSEDESSTDDVVEEESSVNEEAEETEEQVDEVDITVRGATTTISGPDINAAPELKEEEEEEEEEEVVDDEEDDEDMEDLDLEAIIRELQAEVDALSEDDEEDEEDEVPAVEDEEDEEEVDEGEEEEVEDEEEEEEEVEEGDEDLDLNAILREIEAELSEEDETELAQENTRLQDELAEYRKAVELLRGKLNEVNLLNAKLLFTNKLFRGKELSQDQKIHVVETFDLATTIREVKLLYATLAEATVNVPNKKKQTTSSTEVVAEGIASKVVGGTAPTTEVLEEDQFAGFRQRMKELAGINVL